jgi:hypothetical protein
MPLSSLQSSTSGSARADGCSCGVGWSSSFAEVALLGVDASDAGVDLGSLLLVDPPGWYPFGQTVGVDAAGPAFCRKWVWWYLQSRVRLQVVRYAYLRTGLLRPRRRSRFALRTLAETSTGRNPGRVPIIAHRIGCRHDHPERRHTANRVDPPCRQPAGSVDHLATRTKRHQRQPESDCERSDRGSPGLGPSAGATRKALTFEGWASGRPISPLHKSKANFAAGLLNLSPEHRGQADDRRILVFRDDLSSSRFQIRFGANDLVTK